jgi:5-methylcytosine-specific restriction endonuclease McrA
MINREDWSEDELEIFDMFNGKCIRCSKPAEVIHEDVPKSRKPKTWMEKENRSPLCIHCHNWAHYKGTRYSAGLLRELKRKLLNAI